MTTRDFDYVLDGPANFFQRGPAMSKGCATREIFDNMVRHYRALGKTVHVHEDYHPVFAVIEPKKSEAPAFDMSRVEVFA